MVDVLKKLQTISFRGIKFPVEMDDYAFQHEHAQHKFIFRDDPVQQPLGRRAKTWRYTAVLSENLQSGEWYGSRLFSETYPRLHKAMDNKEPGILITAAEGEFRVVPANFRRAFNPREMRDGCRVELEFTYAPDFSTEEIVEIKGVSINELSNQAGLLDDSLNGVDFPETEPFPEPTVDPFGYIASVGDQISANRDKIKGKLDDVAYRIDKVNSSIDRVGNVDNWSIKRQTNQLYLSVWDTKETLELQGRRIESKFTTEKKSVPQTAQENNMEQQEFLDMNPHVARMIYIPAGTKIKFYKDE